jgi:hypothetical protein
LFVLPWSARVNGARVLPCGTTCVTSPASGITWGPSLSTCLRASTPAAADHSAATSASSACQGKLETRSVLVVSHHLDGLLRAPHRIESGAGPTSGRTRSQVYCNLLPTGVRRVSAAGDSPRDVAVTCRVHIAASSRRVHTPRRFPRQQPHRVTTAVAPLTFRRSFRPQNPTRSRAPGAGNRRSREDRWARIRRSGPPRILSSRAEGEGALIRCRTLAPATSGDSRLRGVAPLPSRSATRPLPDAGHFIFHGLCSPSRYVP